MDNFDLWQGSKTAYNMVFKGSVDLFCLKAALDLKLFEVMASGPQDVAALAQATGSVPLRLNKFLTALEQIGLVSHNQSLWQLTPLAEQFFVDQTNHRNLTMLPFMDYISSIIDTYYLNMAKVVRGELDFTSVVPYPPRTVQDSVFYETLHRSNTHFPIKILTENANLDGVKHLVDMGGGIGDIAIALCRKYPELKITLLNLPSAIGLVQENVAAAGLSDRIQAVALDMYREPLMKADAVLISRILYPMPAHFCEMVIRQAAQALEPGGRLILLDLNISDPQNPNYDYLTHYLSAVGTDFAPMEFKDQSIYANILNRVGFGEISFFADYENILYQAVKQPVMTILEPGQPSKDSKALMPS